MFCFTQKLSANILKGLWRQWSKYSLGVSLFCFFQCFLLFTLYKRPFVKFKNRKDTVPVGVAVVVIIRKMGLQPSMVSKMVSQVPCEQPPSEWNFHTNSGACNLSTGRELSRSDPYSIDLSNKEKKNTFLVCFGENTHTHRKETKYFKQHTQQLSRDKVRLLETSKDTS